MQISKRMKQSCGCAPAIVLTTIDPAHLVCSIGVSEGAKSERAQTAWRNYHVLVEVAKKRAGRIHSHGAALFVELQSADDADTVCQLGYCLTTFPLRAAIEAGREIDDDRESSQIAGRTA